jgi:uncharacterized protein (UPF0333 family)
MKNRGLVSLEYAVFIAVIVAGLLAMSIYLQRSICGKIRDSGDTFGFGRQYSPP